MPDVTPIYGFPYQVLGDGPNGPTLGQDLAEAVEATLQAQLALKVDKGACQLRQTVAQSVPHVTSTPITLDAVDVDTGGMADLANDRIVIQKTGIYLLTGIVAFSAHATGYRRAHVRLNGADILPMDARDANTTTGLATVPQVQLTRELTVGDLVTLVGLQTSGVELNTQASSPYHSILSAAMV
jgi:hypothetical protein